jgi:hypothetical protein
MKIVKNALRNKIGDKYMSYVRIYGLGSIEKFN